jgi:hypothetical protein
MAKLVRIQDITYLKLANHGHCGDTMDSIVLRLLNIAEDKDCKRKSSDDNEDEENEGEDNDDHHHRESISDYPHRGGFNW